MIRRPPRSTPFPTRRSSDLLAGRRLAAARFADQRQRLAGADLERHVVDRDEARSEEHTSELQSQSNLVCRLLLEKKKPRTFSGTHGCPEAASQGGSRRASLA